MLKGNPAAGASLLFRGFSMLNHPRLRIFVWLPIIINVFIFVILSTVLFQLFTTWLNALMDWLPNWLDFLAWIVGFLSAIVIFVLYALLFSAITNFIAAPFYGFLAERVEQIITAQGASSERLLHQIHRTIKRELTKWIYSVPRYIAMALLLIFPPIGQILIAVWTSWFMTLQYCDYAADNQQTEFIDVRAKLKEQLLSTHGFGGMVMLGMMVPVLNIFVVPAAVIGGTLYWLELENSAGRQSQSKRSIT